MRTTKQILPGIKAIGWVLCDKLIADIALRGIAGMAVPILTDIHMVDFFGEPECVCVTANDNGNRLDTATLKFASENILPLHSHIALVVTNINGCSYIIGAKEAAFPVIKRTISFGDTSNDRACTEYEITHSAIKSLVRCDI